MNQPIAVVPPGHLGRRSPIGRWVYLGKDAAGYRRARARLGADHEWSYEEKLRETAEELRQPFLDFVADVGARQQDPITWWSTRFSWKLWTTSDLFLLVCYLAIAQSCIEEALRGGFSLLVVVEDPWLLRQLKENLNATQPDVRVEVRGLLRERLSCVVLGTVRRLGWLWAVIRNRWRQKRLWPRRETPAYGGKAAGIFSYPSKSAFETPGRWHDAHLPDLDRLLADLGYRVVRFTPPECGGWEKELAERSADATPLILWATGDRILRSLTAFWWPRWPESLSLKELPIRWLCFREWWLEVGRSSLCVYRMFYECLQGMLSQGSWQCLITFYENQPWEKLQVLAARTKGVRTVGLQITTFSRYHLSYAMGKGEAGRMPLPDRIGSSGAAPHRLLMECGVPAASLRSCGALRYSDLTRHSLQNSARNGSSSERTQILVVLSIDPVLSRHLLEALHQSFPDGGAETGLHFTIRPHPMYPIPSGWVRFPATLIPSSLTDFRESLQSFGLVLFTASTVGFEALAEGKAALRYRSPRLFDLDELYGPHLPVVSDSNLRSELLSFVREGNPPRSREETLRFISDFFAPVDRAELKGILS